MTSFLECGPFKAQTDDGRVLFDNVSISISDSQSVAVEGASGSGKSTLLRHLTAITYSPKASRRLEGKSYEGSSLPMWRAKVTLVAQDAPMIPGSLEANLVLPFRQRAGRNKIYSKDAARNLLGKVGLGSVPLDRDIKLLSGGERHRVGLVRGLLWDPPVLVADESLAGLDPDTAKVCFDLLLDYAQKPGRLLVCVLHSPTLTERVTTRLRLVDGRLEEG
ncbi:MAG: ATP-binding cassette domain-containing protein [Myxococcota bacterium]|nr:ATP-binding cassette domain-containing protein [Myxococcota bacterium]